jgi:hypothetical protein
VQEDRIVRRQATSLGCTANRLELWNDDHIIYFHSDPYITTEAIIESNHSFNSVESISFIPTKRREWDLAGNFTLMDKILLPLTYRKTDEV